MQVSPVRGASQEVAHTKSRRSGPRRWRRAVEWLIAASLHPRATVTTLRVAHDLADRMDYDTGHVRYCLEETAARLGVSTATVKRHVAVLRELGALAWVVHGTRTNVRRLLGLEGYAGTATVYAAVIPAAYDHAMGNRIVGAGYTARVVVGLRRPVDDRPLSVDRGSVSVDGPVDGCAAGQGHEPPSLVLVDVEGQVKAMGGVDNDTSRKRASRSTTPLPHQTSSNSKGSRRTPMQVARDIQTARRVRALVNWTQAEGLRRLAFALRPLIDRGLDGDRIASELLGLCVGWRPARPAAFITARLANEQTVTAPAPQELVVDVDDTVAPNSAWNAAREQVRRSGDDGTVTYPAIEAEPLTVDEADMLRALAVQYPQRILAYAELQGEAAAVALYGRLAVDNARTAAVSAAGVPV